ncbi:MAG: MBL fold metallo-hydrolase [Candidatus Hodarchaeales archaeon]|jgi:glyoxylase-like metal-dependent hydrolase (beta-lactamase superfamily II)
MKDTEITPEEFHIQLQSGDVPLIIDVRNNQIFSDWNIFNSRNFPIMQLLALNEVPEEYSNQEIVLICGKGNDSLMGARHLQNLGANARSLKGGLTEWNTVFDTTEMINESDLKLVQIRRIARGCLSYLLYSNGEAIVVDPAQHISPYIRFAEEKDLLIIQIIDSHLHADHISGARALAKETGAEVYLNPQDPYEFEFKTIEEDFKFKINNKQLLRVITTPGHTPGSTSFVMKNLGILTGDMLFVDGIGRPDLLNQTASFAKDLYSSLTKKVATLPDSMFYAPAHHGKFELEHFGKPIASDIASFRKDSLIQKDEESFINYAVERSELTKEPASYRTIREVNMGSLVLSQPKINELEVGPNRCAIS